MAQIESNSSIRIYLRNDQKLLYINKKKYRDNRVKILAPDWVHEALKQLQQYIPVGTQLSIVDISGRNKIIKLEKELTLKDLIIIARNEPSNNSGKIKFSYYQQLINDKSIIYSIKDLVRNCIIVGNDMTAHYGGYGSKRVKQKKNIILIDLIGLQFQKIYNTGRLVLTGKDLPKGLLDDFIYKSIVGHKKKTYSELVEEKSDRYLKHIEDDVYFDLYAYRKFVSNDILLTGLAINLLTERCVNFKFLKYGTGIFAANYNNILENYITVGIAEGLEKLFRSGDNLFIKSVEFPYFSVNQNIINICNKYNIDCLFSNNDALKQSEQMCECHRKAYMTATTNCSDPHVITGNSMYFNGVDICANLKSKGNKFSPIINPLIKEKYLDLNKYL